MRKDYQKEKKTFMLKIFCHFNGNKAVSTNERRRTREIGFLLKSGQSLTQRVIGWEADSQWNQSKAASRLSNIDTNQVCSWDSPYFCVFCPSFWLFLQPFWPSPPSPGSPCTCGSFPPPLQRTYWAQRIRPIAGKRWSRSDATRCSFLLAEINTNNLDKNR